MCPECDDAELFEINKCAVCTLTAMTAPAAPADVKDDLLQQIRRLLDKKKPELQTEWEKVDCSDFEPVARLDLLAAILCRLIRGASDLGSAQPQPSSSRSRVASPGRTTKPAKSFKDAVASPARPSECNNFENRLAEVELSLREHKQRFRELDQKAEDLDRENRQLNLIVYNVPETTEKDNDGLDAFCSLLDKCMPDGRECEGADWAQVRLGTYCQEKERPRPIHVILKSMEDKHTFLKHAKHLKEVNLKYDDDLTRLQQQQRQDMSADFDILKSKGHKPFYRGSSLKFRHADKTRTCKRHGAIRAPDAQV